jgi:hypothetical protein
MAKIHQICAALHADRGKVAGRNALVTTRATLPNPQQRHAILDRLPLDAAGLGDLSRLALGGSR